MTHELKETRIRKTTRLAAMHARDSGTGWNWNSSLHAYCHLGNVLEQWQDAPWSLTLQTRGICFLTQYHQNLFASSKCDVNCGRAIGNLPSAKVQKHLETVAVLRKIIDTVDRKHNFSSQFPAMYCTWYPHHLKSPWNASSRKALFLRPHTL